MKRLIPIFLAGCFLLAPWQPGRAQSRQGDETPFTLEEWIEQGKGVDLNGDGLIDGADYEIGLIDYIPFESWLSGPEVEGMLAEIKRYWFRVEMANGSGYVSESTFDLDLEAAHTSIRLSSDPPREVEYYWMQDRASARSGQGDLWFPVWVPGTPVSRFHALFELLRNGTLNSVVSESLEGEPCWVASTTPDLSRLRSNSAEYAQQLLPQPCETCDENKRVVERVQEALTQVEMEAQFWVSKESHYLKQVILTTQARRILFRTIYQIRDINGPDLAIAPPPEALDPQGPLMPLSALFIHLGDLK